VVFLFALLQHRSDVVLDTIVMRDLDDKKN